MEAILGPLAAFGSSCTWAIGSAAYASLSHRYHPAAINASRSAVALPLALVFTWISAGNLDGLLQLQWGNVSWLILSAISSYALADILFFWSTHTLGVPGALTVASIYPLWAALAGWAFRGELLSGTRLVGLVLVIIGTMAVIWSGSGKPIEKKKYWIGVLLAFGTSLFWALNSFSGAMGASGIPAEVAVACRMAISLLLCPALGFLVFGNRKVFLPTREVPRLFWVFALEGFGGAFFFMYALSHAPLSIAAPLTSLAPVLSVPVALVMKTEVFSMRKFIGIVTVVAGVWVLL